ncbi:ankyrin repeat domain-containing protein 49 isoform X2 [Diabrotica virgifera virgifera]|uniref:Ankyrin repeat domain-containing protein 49-like isoform X1 n=2 Tax=Diabrotica virgifera virgifera TaxID=50390 RepID=A0A6P7F2G6_DIAVI|nr:ankyrin repeat domain-containing protein 49 isoform X2 [Diabrotica virgifera virgifera]
MVRSALMYGGEVWPVKMVQKNKMEVAEMKKLRQMLVIFQHPCQSKEHSRMNDERFLVSGWEDDLNDIDESRNPEVKFEDDLLQACENGNLKLIQAILETEPNLIHAVDKDKYTALHRACYSNHIDIVKYLLQKGANIAAQTEMLWQPLHSCCQWNHKDCAAILIQHGADINARTEGGQTPLHIAAAHGASYDTVQMLLMHPYIDTTIKNSSGETAKDIATRSSRYYNVFEMADPLLGIESIKDLK